jgi:hypothetical protein
MTAPLESATVPVMVPVMTDCPLAIEANASAAKINVARHLPSDTKSGRRFMDRITFVLFILPPELSRLDVELRLIPALA